MLNVCRVFFDRLAKKGNAIYNILPDLISSLSVNPEITSAAFKSIMKFQFSFIDKEKQAETLTEKLCHRFLVCKGMNVHSC